MTKRVGILGRGLRLVLAGTVLGTGLLLVAPAESASAAPAPIVTGQAQAVPVGTGSLTVYFACEAVSASLAAATGVGCYIEGKLYGDRHYAPDQFLPGNASVVHAVYPGLAVQGYRLCVHGLTVAVLGADPGGWSTSFCIEDPL